MGFLDNVSSAVNRGTSSVGRAADKAKLKSQLGEINKRRQQLAAQLGASLYDATKDDPALRAGREPLFDGIAACDAERAACQQQIDIIDAQAAAATVAASTFQCAVCGTTMNGNDLFCAGCGTPAAQAMPQQAAPQAPAATGTPCPQCGAPVGADDLFCMSCGYKLGGAPEQAPVQETVTVVEEVVIETAPENPENKA